MEVGQTLAYGLWAKRVPIPRRRASLSVVFGFILFVGFGVLDRLDEEPFLAVVLQVSGVSLWRGRLVSWAGLLT